ncbi:MAG: PTS sugar transporter subunit IIA [bacterium]
MIGVVICTHDTLAQALLDTASMIVGEFPQAAAVSVRRGDPMDDVLARLRAAIAEVDAGDGILLLCDMFGGTPSNLSLSFLNEVEVVTGVNLPMLLKLYTSREGDVAAVAAAARDHARENILVAGELLRARGKGA